MPDGSRTSSASAPSADLGRVAQLFRDHLVFVRRVLRRFGVQPSDLDDAVQETFLVVHRRIGDFEGRAAERTWLYSVAMRVASTQRRTAMRESSRRERAGAQMHATRPLDPERELSASEAAAVLDQLLGELDEGKRSVFVLAELEGVPVPEVAQILDLNVRTTHSRLRLARERFSAALARHHAREEGLMRRHTLRALAARGRPPAPTPAQQRASWAALAVQLGGGAPPAALLPWWSALGGAVPFAATVAVGLGGVALVWTLTKPPTQDGSLSGSPSGSPASVATKASSEAPAGPSGQAAPVALPPKDTNEVSAAVATVVAPHVAPKPRARVGAARSPASDVAPEGLESGDGLLAETQLLEGARRSERAGDREAALGLLDEHELRFPKGVLRSERLSTRVRVLCGLGRRDDATDIADTPALLAVVRAHCTPSSDAER